MQRKNIRSELISLSCIILMVCAFKSTFAANYTVPTGSMRPTILPGDKIFVNKIAYDVRIPFTKIRLWQHGSPRRGDVIVFESPRDPSMTLVKRLIGLPGDLIEVDDGFIRVNGKENRISLADHVALDDILRSGGTYRENAGQKKPTL